MKTSVFLCLILTLQLADKAHGASAVPEGLIRDVTTATTPIPAGIRLTSTTDVIRPGLTHAFSVMCTFPNPADLGLASIISLVLSIRKTDVKNQDVATLNIVEPLTVKELSSIGARVSGRLDEQGQSFMKLDWTYPSENDSALYTCEATGLNNLGHPVSSSATIRVTSTLPDLYSLVNAFRTVSKQQEIVIRRLEDRVQVLEQFYISPVSAGKAYLVSRTGGHNISHAEALCNLAGGHLTDVRNQAELDAIKDFLQTLPAGNPRITTSYFSPTDENQRGRWVYRHSGELMTYPAIWRRGSPYSSSTSNCALIGHYDWKAINTVCSGHPYTNFICEKTTIP